MSAIAYEIERLTKRYRPDQPPANDTITLTIERGEVFGLLGPNGAGKTTLVRQLAALCRPTDGAIRLFGQDLVRRPHLAGSWVALQPQGIALPVSERTRTLLEITGQLRGLSTDEARRETTELMEALNLVPHANKTVNDLSGGLRRLTAIATALIGRRPVLIFDEPTNELDPEVRRVVWERIRRCAREGAAVILVTHNVVEAEQALDRVAIMREGRVLALGTPGSLKGRVARRVRLEVLFQPEADGAARDVLAPLGDAVALGARRYAIAVERHRAEEAIARLLPHLSRLDDFRIVTPNLEDVYLELSGGERLAG